MSLGDQDALDFAQDLVRIGLNSSTCGRTTRSMLFAAKGRAASSQQHIDRAGFGGLLAQWNPAGMEEIALRQAELERVEAENIGNGVIHAG